MLGLFPTSESPVAADSCLKFIPLTKACPLQRRLCFVQAPPDDRFRLCSYVTSRPARVGRVRGEFNNYRSTGLYTSVMMHVLGMLPSSPVRCWAAFDTYPTPSGIASVRWPPICEKNRMR